MDTGSGFRIFKSGWRFITGETPVLKLLKLIQAMYE